MPRGRTPGQPQPAPRPGELEAQGVPEANARLAVGVAELRLGRGWTRQQLADAARINHAVIAGIEDGSRDPSFSTLVKLRRGLGDPPWEELLGA